MKRITVVGKGCFIAASNAGQKWAGKSLAKPNQAKIANKLQTAAELKNSAGRGKKDLNIGTPLLCIACYNVFDVSLSVVCCFCS